MCTRIDWNVFLTTIKKKDNRSIKSVYPDITSCIVTLTKLQQVIAKSVIPKSLLAYFDDDVTGKEYDIVENWNEGKCKLKGCKKFNDKHTTACLAKLIMACEKQLLTLLIKASSEALRDVQHYKSFTANLQWNPKDNFSKTSEHYLARKLSLWEDLKNIIPLLKDAVFLQENFKDILFNNSNNVSSDQPNQPIQPMALTTTKQQSTSSKRTKKFIQEIAEQKREEQINKKEVVLKEHDQKNCIEYTAPYLLSKFRLDSFNNFKTTLRDNNAATSANENANVNSIFNANWSVSANDNTVIDPVKNLSVSTKENSQVSSVIKTVSNGALSNYALFQLVQLHDTQSIPKTSDTYDPSVNQCKQYKPILPAFLKSTPVNLESLPVSEGNLPKSGHNLPFIGNNLPTIASNLPINATKLLVNGKNLPPYGDQIQTSAYLTHSREALTMSNFHSNHKKTSEKPLQYYEIPSLNLSRKQQDSFNDEVSWLRDDKKLNSALQGDDVCMEIEIDCRSPSKDSEQMDCNLPVNSVNAPILNRDSVIGKKVDKYENISVCDIGRNKIHASIMNDLKNVDTENNNKYIAGQFDVDNQDSKKCLAENIEKFTIEPCNSRSKYRKVSAHLSRSLLLEKVEDVTKDCGFVCDYCQSGVDKNRFGQHEELLVCKDCGNKAHPSCLSYSQELVEQIRSDGSWQCIDCKACIVCNGTGDPDTLLFCDACDKGYHMNCHSPKLDQMPSGKWACGTCVTKGKTVTSVSKQQVFVIDDEDEQSEFTETNSVTKNNNDGSKSIQKDVASLPIAVSVPQKLTSAAHHPPQSVNQPANFLYRPTAMAASPSAVTTMSTGMNMQLPINQPQMLPVSYVMPNAATQQPLPHKQHPTHVLGTGAPNKMSNILNPTVPLPDVRSAIREDVLRVLPIDVADWTVKDVGYYFKSHGYVEEGELLLEQEIDGRALLLMSRNDCLTGLRIKLGPALKIYHMHIHKLQMRTDFLG